MVMPNSGFIFAMLNWRRCNLSPLVGIALGTLASYKVEGNCLWLWSALPLTATCMIGSEDIPSILGICHFDGLDVLDRSSGI
jgi:hypothetical protein